MSFAKLSLTGRALKYLSQREHSRLELERKLAPHVEEGEDLAAVLDALEAKNFINPERVAQSVVYTRSKKLGTARVVHELRQKGLDDETVRAAAAQMRETEHARAWAVWLQKFGTPPATPQERMKQMRFLASRGFGGEVVNKVLKGQAPDTQT